MRRTSDRVAEAAELRGELVRQPLSARKRVVNIGAYFDALRASVPGLSSTKVKSPPPRRSIIEVIHARERARRAHT